MTSSVSEARRHLSDGDGRQQNQTFSVSVHAFGGMSSTPVNNDNKMERQTSQWCFNACALWLTGGLQAESSSSRSNPHQLPEARAGNYRPWDPDQQTDRWPATTVPLYGCRTVLTLIVVHSSDCRLRLFSFLLFRQINSTTFSFRLLLWHSGKFFIKFFTLDFGWIFHICWWVAVFSLMSSSCVFFNPEDRL